MAIMKDRKMRAYIFATRVILDLLVWLGRATLHRDSLGRMTPLFATAILRRARIFLWRGNHIRAEPLRRAKQAMSFDSQRGLESPLHQGDPQSFCATSLCLGLPAGRPGKPRESYQQYG